MLYFGKGSGALKFTKMQGLGNDFVLLDCREGLPEGMPRLARALCDRRLGPGADGVLCLCPSCRADWRMRVFNADGSEAETCGNGLRCLGRWLRERGLMAGESAQIETGGGVRRVTVPAAGAVMAELGLPRVGEERKIAVKDMAYTGVAVSMGNPHFVIPAASLPAVPLAELGPLLEGSFPAGSNIELVRLVCRERIELRVWERGCGETPACGTGACAAAAALYARGELEDRVTAVMPGGRAEVRFDRLGRVSLIAPAVTVYEGELAEGWAW